MTGRGCTRWIHGIMVIERSGFSMEEAGLAPEGADKVDAEASCTKNPPQLR